MTGFWTRRMAATGLGLAATLLLSVAGCGGDSERVDEAVVVPEPGTNVGAGAPAAGAPSASTETASASPNGKTTETTAPAAAATGGYGTLKGQVLFDGEPPSSGPLVAVGQAAKNPEVCAAKDAVPDQRFVVDKDSKGVKWALVYIPRPAGKVSPEAESAAKSATYEFDQHNCTFVPHVLGMAKGGKLVVKSSDPVGHNVHSTVENYGSINNAVQPNESLPPIDLKFPTSRPGEVVCDIHPWMKAFWLVTNSPYVTTTDDKGNFELKNVPAGTQKIVVWQEGCGGFVTPSSGEAVEVKADGETTHAFHIKQAQVKVK